MNPILEPGTYLFNVPDRDGQLVLVCRCPGCLATFHTLQSSKPDAERGHPVQIECMDCRATNVYRSCNYSFYSPPTKSRRGTAVRRRNRPPDTPLFG